LLARIERRARYEIARKSRNRSRFRRSIAAVESAARTYCAALGLDSVLQASTSTGASLSDYMLLHRYVLAHKPRLVVEFGSGKSTIVLAHALNAIGGHLVTYEAIRKYHENLVAIVPTDLRSTITAICSEAIVTDFRGISGVRYADQAPADAEFFFVDGPTETISGVKGACLDLLFYLERYPAMWITAIIDQKFSSQDAYQSVLPDGAVRYDPVMDVGIIPGICGELLHPRKTPWRIRHADVWQALACSAPPGPR
jgi:hypothetical protein